MKTEQLKLSTGALAISLCLLMGCEPRTPTAGRHPSTTILNSAAQADPTYSEFATTVKKFYDALQAKDWRTTYEIRTSDFKQDVTWQFYLDSMNRDGKAWSLNNYEVLNMVKYDGSTIRLIMEFDENGITSYNVVWWKKEGQTWHCMEAGPSRLSLFNRTRMPEL